MHFKRLYAELPKSYTFESYLRSDFYSPLIRQLPSLRKIFSVDQCWAATYRPASLVIAQPQDRRARRQWYRHQWFILISDLIHPKQVGPGSTPKCVWQVAGRTGTAAVFTKVAGLGVGVLLVIGGIDSFDSLVTREAIMVYLKIRTITSWVRGQAPRQLLIRPYG